MVRRDRGYGAVKGDGLLHPLAITAALGATLVAALYALRVAAGGDVSDATAILIAMVALSGLLWKLLTGR